MRNLLLIIFAIILFSAVSCETIPPGNAPDGEIVNPGKDSVNYSWQRAENYFVTSLSMYCFQNFPQGSRFCLDFGSKNIELQYWSFKLLRELQKLVPVKLDNSLNAKYMLKSTYKKNVWTMQLVDNKSGKIVWKDFTRIKEKKK